MRFVANQDKLCKSVPLLLKTICQPGAVSLPLFALALPCMNQSMVYEPTLTRQILFFSAMFSKIDFVAEI